MKILLIEDTAEFANLMQIVFRIRWPDVVLLSAASAAKGIDLIASEEPDFVILDLGLPDADGLNALRKIRDFSNVPLIIVTGRGDESSRVQGLEFGADDYVTKPPSPTELLARVQAVLRRARRPGIVPEEGTYQGRGLFIDLAERRLLVNDKETMLTPTEWRLLSYLVRNEGTIISHDVLTERVWGSEFVEPSTVRMSIRRLRAKLGDDLREPSIIRSHRAVGYSFVLPR